MIQTLYQSMGWKSFTPSAAVVAKDQLEIAFCAHRHPSPREVDDCQLAFSSHFDRIQDLVHQIMIELPDPSLLLQE